MSSSIMDKDGTHNESIILVVAANGLIASHVVDQLLARGFRVRGTVRSCARTEWMGTLFDAKYGPGRFERVEVPDASAVDAWDKSVEGVAGIVDVLGKVDLSMVNCDEVADEELAWHIALLETALKKPTVKTFVFTGSAWAAWTPDPDTERTLAEWSWNEEAVELARSHRELEEKGLAPFMALKTLVERGVWAWVRRHSRLPFAFNSILLDTVIGPTLQPKELGIPSTAGMVQWIYEGKNLSMLALLKPQWFVDARDAALLYVAVLTTPGVDGERLFGFADRYSWSVSGSSPLSCHLIVVCLQTQ
ncbi:hypothetical protein VTK73DRAFT_4231 [Phialemonium thermophilum]|uniref:NAD-dependent epimerase/dehydratase domain-containing protein n=1 Tax=Phialemonium thermophilum TaxID=223376 RepID=A0ABR3WV69_9PEZI